MKFDKVIRIAVGNSRKSISWPETEMMWSDFCERVRTPQRGSETQDEYMAFPKAKQDELKDVGGFVGGTFTKGHRKAAEVAGRDLITLDMDNIPSRGTDDIIRRVAALGCASLIYSTRKHSAYKPRLRVILPLARTISADEYEPCARKLAELIGIAHCDPTTFEPSRLMYWPSASKGAEYVYQVTDAAFVDPAGILGMYQDDWRDPTSWPRLPDEGAIQTRRVAKAEDPKQKKGIVGAFCREYDILTAMETFIAGMYEPTADPNRYTYTGGTTTGGAILYGEGQYLYSHHATDPCSGKLVNAFDLIRLHMFGDADAEAHPETPVNRLPSYTAMTKFALENEAVAARMARERHDAAVEAFSEDSQPDLQPEEDESWKRRLTIDGNGNYQKTTNNIYLILENDPQLKDRIATDVFANRGVVLDTVPWSSKETPRQWSDADDAGCLRYLETFYGIYHKDKTMQMLSCVGAEHEINRVREYLDGLTWDGVPRLDRLLIDYLGAEDIPFNKVAIRKSLCAAVARVYEAGTKFDCMTIIHGPQGIGKSTLLRTLGGEWFSDSLTTFEGKDAAELIQGVWIIEVGELTAMSKKDTNAVKQFLSKCEDQYRAAYGRHVMSHDRRCVFFGTSNEEEFLRDQTGNRRFWPVDVGLSDPIKDVWSRLPDERDQIWAEAVALYRAKEPLYLSAQEEAWAEEVRRNHLEDNGLEGQISLFLDKKVPENWQSLGISERRLFYGQPTAARATGLAERDRVCAQEIMIEMLGYTKAKAAEDKVMSRAINTIMNHMPGWEMRRLVCGPYGKQKAFKRKPDTGF